VSQSESFNLAHYENMTATPRVKSKCIITTFHQFLWSLFYFNRNSCKHL